MQSTEITLLVSTYQRPRHLRRALLSIAMQRDVAGKMELVVTDDGSQDETRAVVEAFAREVDFPVRMTTHPSQGFRLSRCRNEGVAASRAPYLLFTDGDCLLPPDHVAAHLEFRRRGTVIAGDCYRLSQAASERISEASIRSGEYVNWVSWRQRARMAKKAIRGQIDHVLGCRMRPRLTGSNIALWREDFERVNGFDENYVGWGLEDRDLQLRLSRIGVSFRPILGRTAPYHLWHPMHATYSHNNASTPNLDYYRRRFVFTRCRSGLVKRKLSDLKIRVIGDDSDFPEIKDVLRRFPKVVTQEGVPAAGMLRSVLHTAGAWTAGLSSGRRVVDADDHADVEILLLRDQARFTGSADCNVLVVQDEGHIPAALLRTAHMVIATPGLPATIPMPQFARDKVVQPLKIRRAA